MSMTAAFDAVSRYPLDTDPRFCAELNRLEVRARNRRRARAARKGPWRSARSWELAAQMYPPGHPRREVVAWEKVDLDGPNPNPVARSHARAWESDT
jgi:hypothetical protein